ncbi:MAG TPA: helix-turn-helix domain-containing protein, partial [Ktedonobacteraceae bacterium]|nr:helix-turn-helix domain-containing protein [Ktedonobacteraceae bacterium]
KYLTAVEAAKRIGVSEKTIRLWVKEGKLEAHHPAKNRLAIAEADVERIAKERQLYYGTRPETPFNDRMQPDVSALEARIRELEDRVTALETTRHVPTDIPRQSVPVPATSTTIPQPKPPIRNVAHSEIPDGCILARYFARMHGVPESSFRRHIASGIGDEKVEAGTSKHGRYLTPEQQEATLEFWQRHNVKFTRLE